MTNQSRKTLESIVTADTLELKNQHATILQMTGLLTDVINSYDDTGCDDCGVIDSLVHDKIAVYLINQGV